MISGDDMPEGFVVCAGFAAAEQAVLDGVPRDRIVVDVDSCSGAGSSARAGAVATVCLLAGFGAVRTSHVTEVQRCLDMTESVLGRRPPALALRGLA